MQLRVIRARHHLEIDCSSRISSARSLISCQEYWISLLSLYLEQIANRRKYVSLIFDGTRWIFPAPLILFSRFSFKSFEPCKNKNQKINYQILNSKRQNWHFSNPNVQFCTTSNWNNPVKMKAIKVKFYIRMFKISNLSLPNWKIGNLNS